MHTLKQTTLPYMHILYGGNLMQEEIFVNCMILLSEKIFVIFGYCIHNRGYIEDVNVCWL